MERLEKKFALHSLYFLIISMFLSTWWPTGKEPEAAVGMTQGSDPHVSSLAGRYRVHQTSTIKDVTEFTMVLYIDLVIAFRAEVAVPC